MEKEEYKKLLNTAIRGAIREFVNGSSLEISVLKHFPVLKYEGAGKTESRLLSLFRQDVSRFLKDKSFRSEDEKSGIFYVLGEKHLNTIHSFFNGKSNSFKVKLPRVSSKKEISGFIKEFFDKLSNKFLETFDLDKVPSISLFLFTKEVYMKDIYESYEDYSLNINLENFYVADDYFNVKISFDFIPSLYLKNNESVIFKKAFMKPYIPNLLHIPRKELSGDFLLSTLIEELNTAFNARMEDIIKAIEVVFLEKYKLSYIAAFEPGNISPKAQLMYNGEHYRLIIQNLKQSKEVIDNLVDTVDSGYRNFLSEKDNLIRDTILFGYIVPKLFGHDVKDFFNPLIIADNFDKDLYTKLLFYFYEKVGRSSVYLDPLSAAISLTNSAYVFKPKMKINGKNLFIESKPIFRIVADASGKTMALL
jgi:hypothetical protein